MLARVAALAFVLGACGSPSTEAPLDASRDDAGPPIDATITDGAPDAVPDAMIDAPIDADPFADAPPNTVPIVVMQDDGTDTPRPGAIVLWHDRFGALAGRAITGADGRATAEVPGGGSVTVVRDVAGAIVYATTIYQVTTPAELRFGRERYPTAPASLGTMTVHTPMHPTAPATVVTDGCTSARASAGVATLPIVAACLGGAHDLVAYGTELAGPGLHGSLFMANTTYATGADVTLTGGFAATTPFELTVAHLPSGSQYRVERDNGAGDRWFPGGDAEDVTAPSRTVATLALGASMRVTTAVSGAFGFYQARTDVGAAAAAATVDVADLLPAVATLGFDAATRTVRWTTTGAPNPPDAIYVSLAIDVLAGSPREGFWLLVAPPTATALALPALPADVSVGDLAASTTAGITLHESPRFASYADFTADADRDVVRRVFHGVRPGVAATTLSTSGSAVVPWAAGL